MAGPGLRPGVLSRLNTMGFRPSLSPFFPHPHHEEAGPLPPPQRGPGRGGDTRKRSSVGPPLHPALPHPGLGPRRLHGLHLMLPRPPGSSWIHLWNRSGREIYYPQL